MTGVVFRFDGASATEALDCILRPAERIERNGAIIVSGRVARFGDNRAVKMADRARGSALGRHDDSEVVMHDRMLRRHAQQLTVHRFSFAEAAGPVMSDRSLEERVELVPRSIRHVLKVRRLALSQCHQGPRSRQSLPQTSQQKPTLPFLLQWAGLVVARRSGRPPATRRLVKAPVAAATGVVMMGGNVRRGKDPAPRGRSSIPILVKSAISARITNRCTLGHRRWAPRRVAASLDQQLPTQHQILMAAVAGRLLRLCRASRRVQPRWQAGS